MTERLAEISSDNLVEKLVGSGYSFATWQLPQKQKRQLIVCLDKVQQTDRSLDELSSGFLINSFDEHHPPRPYHIKADIIFTENEPKIDSTISAERIDTFLSQLARETTGSPGTLSSAGLNGFSSFEKIVVKAIEEIRSGKFEKAVLSRFEDMELSAQFSAIDFFEDVCKTYPNAFCSLTHIPGKGLWIGASPELLISKNLMEFKTIALAGTKKLQEGDQLAEIAWTQKDIEEQAFVSRYIINCFKKIRLREFAEHGPKTIKAGSLVHLKTEYLVNLQAVQAPGLADQMLHLLHPTAAVCGMPLDASKTFIYENENFDREFYSGFLGPVNYENSIDLFVNLRCMKISNDMARLYAGAGITEDSIPEKETDEIKMKTGIMRSLLQ